MHGGGSAGENARSWEALGEARPGQSSLSAGALRKEVVFSPLSILASFVKYKVSIGAWIYLWAFYFVPLICISASEKDKQVHSVHRF